MGYDVLKDIISVISEYGKYIIGGIIGITGAIFSGIVLELLREKERLNEEIYWPLFDELKNNIKRVKELDCYDSTEWGRINDIHRTHKIKPKKLKKEIEEVYKNLKNYWTFLRNKEDEIEKTIKSELIKDTKATREIVSCCGRLSMPLRLTIERKKAISQETIREFEYGKNELKIFENFKNINEVIDFLKSVKSIKNNLYEIYNKQEYIINFIKQIKKKINRQMKKKIN